MPRHATNSNRARGVTKVESSPKRKYHPEVSAHSPYLAARREWDERYGDLITRAKNWRTMAALCSLVALVATAGMVWLSARSHVVPFVVLVDNLGRPVASGVADQTSLNDDRLKRSNIFNWVENLRTVTTDGVSQRKAIDRVYAQIASGSAAQTFVSEYYRGDPPFKRAETETVSVEVKSVLPTSDRTYEVEWVETTRDLYGTRQSDGSLEGVPVDRAQSAQRMSARRASIRSAFTSPTRVGRRFSKKEFR
jgi:type IV secretory pathway TrbF-like protein